MAVEFDWKVSLASLNNKASERGRARSLLCGYTREGRGRETLRLREQREREGERESLEGDAK